MLELFRIQIIYQLQNYNNKMTYLYPHSLNYPFYTSPLQTNYAPVWVYNIYLPDYNTSILKSPEQTTVIQDHHKQQNNIKRSINRRNILPNITRKLISYICSQRLTKSVIQKHFSSMNELDLLKFYQHVHQLKRQFTAYISKENLYDFWSGKDYQFDLNQEEHKHYHKIIRILSKRFLDTHARNWILLSKKMKKELKNEHLKYCRKIKKMLSLKQFI